MSKKDFRPRLAREDMEAWTQVINAIKNIGLSNALKTLSGGVGVSVASDTATSDYKPDVVLSAWHNGAMMDIDEYCECYGLPRENITSYKLVSHTGTPYYNVVFKEHSTGDGTSWEDAINDLITDVVPWAGNITSTRKKDCLDRLIISDVHIGMNPNPDNSNNYSHDWSEERIRAVFAKVAEETIKNRKGDVLIIDQLGDLLDGYNEQTTRGGHHLPQLLNNRQAFNLAYEMLMYLIESFAPHYSKITLNNICNDNHAGDFGYMPCKMVKEVCGVRFPHVEVNNIITPYGHYKALDHAIIIAHGKDKQHNKRGLPVHPKGDAIAKIDAYCKFHKLYQSEYVHFCKGDSHQAIFDSAASSDFTWNNYPTLAPPSSYGQNNYNGGWQGFVIEHFTRGYKAPSRLPIWI